MSNDVTMPQLAPLLAAARVDTMHEPTWLYVLNFWDSRGDNFRDEILPDVDHDAVTETLRFYAQHNPDGHVPPQWADVPAVQLNPVPAAPSRLRLRHGDEVMEIDVVAALELAQSLPYIIGQLVAPDLIVDRDADEGRGRTTCPHCGAVRDFQDDAVNEVDIDIRWNPGSFRAWEDELVLDISQADHESATIAHVCENCRKPVALPADTESLWS